MRGSLSNQVSFAQEFLLKMLFRDRRTLEIPPRASDRRAPLPNHRQKNGDREDGEDSISCASGLMGVGRGCHFQRFRFAKNSETPSLSPTPELSMMQLFLRILIPKLPCNDPLHSIRIFRDPSENRPRDAKTASELCLAPAYPGHGHSRTRYCRWSGAFAGRDGLPWSNRFCCRISTTS
jgi:hypothetical protein